MQQMQYNAKKYIRLSHADDKDKNGKKRDGGESDSVANQRAILDSFIAQNPDITDCGEKIDDGYTGILFDRPAFMELMDEIRAGEINCIIVKDLSRFGREYIETGRYLRSIFPALGVRFIALGDGIDTAKGTRGDDMMVTVKSVVNDAYCRDISQKTRSALAARRKDGFYVGASPVYGYRKSGEDKNKLAVDEYPAGVVREIYRMKIDGLSAAAIAAELNRRGVLCPLEYKKDKGLPHAKGGVSDVAGAKWAPVAVLRILRDETYTGTLVQGRKTTPSYKLKQVVDKPADEWVRVTGAHEAVVPKSVYDLVQYLCLLDTRANNGAKEAHLFSGLVVCGGCGSRMNRKSVPYKGKQYHYWFCPNGKRHVSKTPGQPPPKPVMVKDEKLAECVLDTLKAHVAHVADLEKLLQASLTERQQSRLAKQYRAQVEESKRRMEKAAALKAGLNQHLLSGVLTKANYNELKQGYIEEEKQALRAMEQAHEALALVVSGGDERLQWMRRFQEFAGLSTLDRRTVVNLIHDIRVVAKDELEITFQFQQDYEDTLARFVVPAASTGEKEVA